MIGAIAGDIIGSPYESYGNRIKTVEFPLFSERSRFTDDSVLTVAVADCLLNKKNYASVFKEYVRNYKGRGYGKAFGKWAWSDCFKPYNSYGNGSAMRVSPIGYAFDDMEEVLEEAEKSAIVTHSHPEGIKGAKSVAASIFLARKGSSKSEIKEFVEENFQYDLSRGLDDIRHCYEFDVTCQGSVPESIIAFLESGDFEEALRLSISLGGDADTMACISGSIAEAFYGGVPKHIEEKVFVCLDDYLGQMTKEFRETFIKQD